MKILAIEWESVSEAEQALQTFPFCGDCKRAAKLQQIAGRILTLCVARPHCHRGLSDRKTE